MGLKKFYHFLLIPTLLGLAASCGNNVPDYSLIPNAGKEIAAMEVDGKKAFNTYDTPQYFAIAYRLQQTPENEAKLLTLCINEELAKAFRENVFKKLEKGDILARIVKEGKGLAFAVSTGELEFHVYYSPQELATIFKK